MTDFIPDDPADLTPAWLNDVLVRSEALEGTRVTSLDLERIAERAGVNGRILRLHLAYEGAAPPAAPATLIAKLPGETAAARGVLTFQRWHEREARFYLELAPHSGIDTPECHYAAYDEAGRCVLLLDDLGHRRLGDQLAGCTPAEAEAIVRAMARTHAAWWAHPALEDHPWLPLTTVGLDRAGPVQGALARSWSLVRDTMSAHLPAGIAPVADRLIEAYRELLAIASTPPLTVIHGDCRLDNMFLPAGPGDPPVTVVDWQFTCRCRGAYDLAYFVALDLPVETRREVELPLLEAYLDALAASGEGDYNLAALEQDYARSLLLAFATFVIGAAGRHASDRARRIHEVGLHRLATAILDRNAGALIG